MPTRLISLDYRVPQCDTTLIEFPILIGRAADAEIQLDDHSIANHHCEIDNVDGCLVVRDLDTVHGTFVNSTRISEAKLLPGDHLAVGMLTFWVQSDSAVKRKVRTESAATSTRGWFVPVRRLGSGHQARSGAKARPLAVK